MQSKIIWTNVICVIFSKDEKSSKAHIRRILKIIYRTEVHSLSHAERIRATSHVQRIRMQSHVHACSCTKTDVVHLLRLFPYKTRIYLPRSLSRKIYVRSDLHRIRLWGVVEAVGALQKQPALWL